MPEYQFASKVRLDLETAAEKYIKASSINKKPRSQINDEYALKSLLKKLEKVYVDEITPYYETAVKQGMFVEDGGGLPAALGDFEFLIASGGLKGPASSLNPENFWNFGLLDKAKAALN